jgi:hypothetical protein
MKRDARVTEFIQGRAAFARPILTHLRKVIHDGGGPGLGEDIKWGMPTFTYRGKIVCGLGAFKAHCALWFREGKEIVGDKPSAAMGQFGRITNLDGLPPAATIKAYVARAVKRIDQSQPAAKTTSARAPRAKKTSIRPAATSRRPARKRVSRKTSARP